MLDRMESVVKHRVTLSLRPELLDAVDRSPGTSRSDKVERLLEEALVGRERRRWVAELRAFYGRAPDAVDRAEDLAWQELAADAFERDE